MFFRGEKAALTKTESQFQSFQPFNRFAPFKSLRKEAEKILCLLTCLLMGVPCYRIDSCLSRFGEPFIHFLLEGEQLLIQDGTTLLRMHSVEQIFSRGIALFLIAVRALRFAPANSARYRRQETPL